MNPLGFTMLKCKGCGLISQTVKMMMCVFSWAALLGLWALSLALSEWKLCWLQSEWTIWLQGPLGSQRSLFSSSQAPLLFSLQKSPSEHTQGGSFHQQTLQEAILSPASSPVSAAPGYVIHFNSHLYTVIASAAILAVNNGGGYLCSVVLSLGFYLFCKTVCLTNSDCITKVK